MTPEEMRAWLDGRRTTERNSLEYSEQVMARLKADDDTDINAQFLANICVELDLTFDFGSGLTLEWMLDHYIAYELERRVYPSFLNIFKVLQERGHTVRNKVEYFNDNEAFYIPHETRRICIFGKTWRDEPRYLVIDDVQDFGNIAHHTFFVRHIWDRTRNNCIGSVDRPTLSFYRRRGFDLEFNDKERVIYGDCRDPGHVLTFKNMFSNHGNCDHTIWNLNAPLRWFFEVGTLAAELCDTPEKENGPVSSRSPEPLIVPVDGGKVVIPILPIEVNQFDVLLTDGRP